MDVSDGQRKSKRKQGLLHMLLGMISATLAFDSYGDDELYLPLTGGRYLLTDRDCPDHIRQNGPEVQKGRSSWFFVLATGSEAICPLYCPAWHSDLRNPIVWKKLAELLCLDEGRVPAVSIFVEYEYVQHEWCGWRSSHSLRYHTFLISLWYDLKDSVVFTYLDSIPVIRKPATGSGKRNRTGSRRKLWSEQERPIWQKVSKTEGLAAGSTNFSEAPALKIRAASIP